MQAKWDMALNDYRIHMRSKELKTFFQHLGRLRNRFATRPKFAAMHGAIWLEHLMRRHGFDADGHVLQPKDVVIIPKTGKYHDGWAFNINTAKAVSLLNDMNKANPQGMAKLMAMSAGEDELSMLDVLNGIFGIDEEGLGVIAASFDGQQIGKFFIASRPPKSEGSGA